MTSSSIGIPTRILGHQVATRLICEWVGHLFISFLVILLNTFLKRLKMWLRWSKPRIYMKIMSIIYCTLMQYWLSASITSCTTKSVRVILGRCNFMKNPTVMVSSHPVMVSKPWNMHTECHIIYYRFGPNPTVNWTQTLN